MEAKFRVTFLHDFAALISRFINHMQLRIFNCDRTRFSVSLEIRRAAVVVSSVY